MLESHLEHSEHTLQESKPKKRKSKVYWTEAETYLLAKYLTEEKPKRQTTNSCTIVREAQQALLPQDRWRSIQCHTHIKDVVAAASKLQVKPILTKGNPIELQVQIPEREVQPPPVIDPLLGIETGQLAIELLRRILLLSGGLAEIIQDSLKRLGNLNLTPVTKTVQEVIQENRQRVEQVENHKQVKREHKPRILIVGFLHSQQQHIKEGLGEALDLRFVTSENIPKEPLQADHCYLCTKFVSHSTENRLISWYGRPNITLHKGGLETLVTQIKNDFPTRFNS